MLLIIEKFALFEVEHIQNMTIFELLFVQICNPIGCFLALSLLNDVHMTCPFKVR